MVFIIQF